MKLRNKKTGKIINFEDFPKYLGHYYSVADLLREWEDYEEPKEQWYIDCDGEVYETVRLNQFDLDRMANIGNLFETKEEAEKAVERLKAWKRLKDGGVKFDLATLSDDTTIVMFARKKKHIHDYDKEIFMLFEDKE